jgi:nitroreductase
MMKNQAHHEINPLFTQRWSPYAYDSQRAVSTADLQGIFEAARWAMSAFNAQPWRYIVGIRGRSQETWDKIYSSLVEGNQGWTQNAPVLAVGLAQKNFEHNGKPNSTAVHDLGAASASLALEAAGRGLAVHQMSGFSPDNVRELFGLDDSIQPFTALAIGYPLETAEADGEFAKRDQRPRERKPLSEIIIHSSL